MCGMQVREQQKNVQNTIIVRYQLERQIILICMFNPFKMVNTKVTHDVIISKISIFNQTGNPYRSIIDFVAII